MNVHPSATDVRSSATSVRPSAMNAVCAASLFKICCIVFFLVTEILYICEWKNAETDIMQYDRLAVNTIVRNKEGEVSSCDILFTEDIEVFRQQYMEYTLKVAESSTDRELSDECMVIGTSAIIDTEIDGAVGMNSGIFNNPFMIWGRYRKRWFRYELPISFQFHHTQMDGAHAGMFLARLQEVINQLYK